MEVMCGRYSSTTSMAVLAKVFHVDEVTVEERPVVYNVAPTQQVLTVASSRDGATRRLGEMRWGLVPSWAKDPSIGSRMINARAETVGTANAYRRAFATRRCLIPADGWFEWQKQAAADGGKARKQPYWIHAADGAPLGLAGIWEVWHGAEDIRWVTCSIITTATCAKRMAEIHDRQPLFLRPEVWDRWLAPERLSAGEAAELLAPANDDGLNLRAISEKVNSVRNDDPTLLEPFEAS
jgi:putative SOS response-associated peptidase YedK